MLPCWKVSDPWLCGTSSANRIDSSLLELLGQATLQDKRESLPQPFSHYRRQARLVRAFQPLPRRAQLNHVIRRAQLNHVRCERHTSTIKHKFVLQTITSSYSINWDESKATSKAPSRKASHGFAPHGFAPSSVKHTNFHSPRSKRHTVDIPECILDSDSETLVNKTSHESPVLFPCNILPRSSKQQERNRRRGSAITASHTADDDVPSLAAHVANEVSSPSPL